MTGPLKSWEKAKPDISHFSGKWTGKTPQMARLVPEDYGHSKRNK
jgi:hypothetical protein